MTFKNRTKIEFDFDSDRRESYERLTQMICSSHWGSGIDIFGFINESHRLLFDFIKCGAIIIYECEYEIGEPCPDSEAARRIKLLLGKRRNHPALREMAALFGGFQFETSARYRNTLYFPDLKAFARADGMKPEDVAEMLALPECEKIILFPYFPLDEKTAYYELTLGAEKDSFIDFMNRVEERRQKEMNEAIIRATEGRAEKIDTP